MTAAGDEVVPAMLKALPDYSKLEQFVDVENLLAYLVAAEIVMTTDGLIGSTGASDHYQYYDPKSGKFFVLPWDPDNTSAHRTRWRTSRSIPSWAGTR